MNKGLIEILQDGAALIEKKSAQTGIVTTDLESCAVHVFIGPEATLFVHDTGQLSVNSIKNLIVKCGPISKCFSVLNKEFMGEAGEYRTTWGERLWRLMMEQHERRRKDLRQKAKLSVAWELRWICGTSVELHTDGRVNTKPIEGTWTEIPDREFRYGVLTLNNAFAPPDDQKIKVDLQFVNGNFTPGIKLLMSPTEMVREAKLKAFSGDPDYLGFLSQHAQVLKDGDFSASPKVSGRIKS